MHKCKKKCIVGKDCNKHSWQRYTRPVHIWRELAASGSTVRAVQQSLSHTNPRLMNTAALGNQSHDPLNMWCILLSISVSLLPEEKQNWKTNLPEDKMMTNTRRTAKPLHLAVISFFSVTTNLVTRFQCTVTHFTSYCSCWIIKVVTMKWNNVNTSFKQSTCKAKCS